MVGKLMGHCRKEWVMVQENTHEPKECIIDRMNAPDTKWMTNGSEECVMSQWNVHGSKECFMSQGSVHEPTELVRGQRIELWEKQMCPRPKNCVMYKRNVSWSKWLGHGPREWHMGQRRVSWAKGMGPKEWVMPEMIGSWAKGIWQGTKECTICQIIGHGPGVYEMSERDVPCAKGMGHWPKDWDMN